MRKKVRKVLPYRTYSSHPDVRHSAITICFSMTDIYRSEILAVVIQQIMDEPVLPVLFLRTVRMLC